MTYTFLKLLARAGGLANEEPLLALFVGAAFLAVFFTALFQKKEPESDGPVSLAWALYRQLLRLCCAAAMVLLLLAAMSGLRTYLSHASATFASEHGRVTQANYNAVQTIWGAEQRQGELQVDIYHDEEITERIESEDLTKPAILRKKTVRHTAVGNPYVSENHVVTLTQNPRKKGSAFYDGFETANHFSWKLRNPMDTPQSCLLKFPLPAAEAVYDNLTARLNLQDVLPRMEIKDGSLLLALDLQPGESFDFDIGFQSRGLSYWYFQISEPREIRDFTLALNLPDLVVRQLNYPGGCMTPTDIKPTADGHGTALTYHLDHALSDKGMGIALPQLPQPGETTRAVLTEIDRAWLLVFAMLALGLTIAGVRHAVLLTILFSMATAFGYGLLANFSDLLFGFWGTAAIILIPLFLFLAWLLKRVGRAAGLMLAVELLLFGVIYPCAAGLDSPRQELYLNLFGLLLLASNTWLLVQCLNIFAPNPPPLPASPQPV